MSGTTTNGWPRSENCQFWLPGKTLLGNYVWKKYFNFLKIYSSQDNKEKEKSGLYLFECAKITAKQHEIKKKLGSPYLHLLSK